jgi:hypothetical protein
MPDPDPVQEAVLAPWGIAVLSEAEADPEEALCSFLSKVRDAVAERASNRDEDRWIERNPTVKFKSVRPEFVEWVFQVCSRCPTRHGALWAEVPDQAVRSKTTATLREWLPHTLACRPHHSVHFRTATKDAQRGWLAEAYFSLWVFQLAPSAPCAGGALLATGKEGCGRKLWENGQICAYSAHASGQSSDLAGKSPRFVFGFCTQRELTAARLRQYC